MEEVIYRGDNNNNDNKYKEITEEWLVMRGWQLQCWKIHPDKPKVGDLHDEHENIYILWTSEYFSDLPF